MDVGVTYLHQEKRVYETISALWVYFLSNDSQIPPFLHNSVILLVNLYKASFDIFLALIVAHSQLKPINLKVKDQNFMITYIAGHLTSSTKVSNQVYPLLLEWVFSPLMYYLFYMDFRGLEEIDRT